MTSWRETTAQHVQDDLDALLAEGLDTAEAMIEQSGEFYPFAMSTDDDGRIAMAAADGAAGDLPQATDVLEALYAGLAADPVGRRAVAFVAGVTVDQADAVRIEVEHRDGGPALAVIAPYRSGGMFRTRITFGDLHLAEGTRRVWR